MPYTKGNPPKRIRKLPKHAQSIWISAYNSADEQGNSEASCNKIAWNAVKTKYKKVGDKWVKKGGEDMDFREWTTKYVNDLPDPCFAWIESGGEKDDEGKTKPRSLRHLPYKNKNGSIDLPHLRNALARLSQVKGLSASKEKSIRSKLEGALKKAQKESGEFGFSIDISGLTFREEQKRTTIQVLPYGAWDHSKYGEINIKNTDLADFVRNFENGVRNDIPITVGHSTGGEEKPAVGWFKELINKGREGLWAIVEWTKKGRKLIEDKAYKYFSPEFCTTYEDPETHKELKNVLVGGALVNKPYFKELAMVLSEQALSQTMKLNEIVKKEAGELTDKEIAFLKKQELTDEAREKFEEVLEDEEGDEEKDEEEDEETEEGEGAEKGEGEEGEKKEEEKKEKKGSEQVLIRAAILKELEKKADMGVEAKKELNEMRIEKEADALIFSEANRKGKLLPKSRGKVKAFLSSLSEGQRKQFKEVLADLPSAKLFSEFGGSVAEPTSARAKLDKAVKEKRENDENLSFRDAVSQVFAENPGLERELS